MSRWIEFGINVRMLDVIADTWAHQLRAVRSETDIQRLQFRIFTDLLVVDSIYRARRRVFLANLIGEVLRFLMLASQAANLLLLIMVVTELAAPWPMMQFMLASGVMFAIMLDVLWIWRGLDWMVE